MRRGTFLAVLAVAGGLALVASAQSWWRAETTGTAGVSVGFSGVEASGGLSQALGLVVLAGLVLSLTLRVTGRRVLAVLLGLAGLAMGLVGAIALQPEAEALRTRVRQVSLSDDFAVTTSAWPWAYAGSGLLVLVAAALLWVGARRWPTRAGRYDRTATASPAPADLADDPAGAWQAMDAGADPTSDPTDQPDTPDPDVHNDASRVTMGDTSTRTTPRRREGR